MQQKPYVWMYATKYVYEDASKQKKYLCIHTCEKEKKRKEKKKKKCPLFVTVMYGVTMYVCTAVWIYAM